MLRMMTVADVQHAKRGTDLRVVDVLNVAPDVRVIPTVVCANASRATQPMVLNQMATAGAVVPKVTPTTVTADVCWRVPPQMVTAQRMKIAVMQRISVHGRPQQVVHQATQRV